MLLYLLSTIIHILKNLRQKESIYTNILAFLFAHSLLPLLLCGCSFKIGACLETELGENKKKKGFSEFLSWLSG